MEAISRPTPVRVGAGHVAAAAIAAFVVYVFVGGLEGTGRHFLELGALRVVLFGALFAFALGSGAHARRSGRAGLVIAGVAAVGFVAGAVGAVATDGWSYDIFGSSEVEAPWYAYVIGASGILFAVGTLLVGIAGRAGSRVAVFVIAAGAMFPLVFILEAPLGAAGAHAVWLVPWMAVAIGLIRAPAPQVEYPRSRESSRV